MAKGKTVAVRYLTPYFGYIILPHVDWLAQCLAQRKSKRNIQKEKIETDKRRKHFFHFFIYLVNGLTNATSQDVAWCPKTPDSKIGVVGPTSLPEREVGSQKTWVFISLHRLQIRHSKILLILARLLPIGYFTFYYFSFFWFLTGWMRGALCVATRLYILYLAADESISGWEFYC